jgi:aryl-alcohol dehydrogenase-like predicted oxidoreductase
MKYRKLGKTDYSVSEIGFGAWGLGGQWGRQKDSHSRFALLKALELGVNFIDTAQAYGDGRSESVIGNVLREYGPGADSVMVATKIPPLPGHWPPLPQDACEARYPRDYLIRAVDASLKRLKREVIDLLQLHTWTRAWNQNPNCLGTLQQLRKQGKIRFIGISTPEQDQNSLIRLMERGLLDTVQVIYNIFDQEAAAQFLGTALEHNVGVIVRCALDEGSLTGKFNDTTTFAKGDWRKNYFRGERLKETLKHVKKVQKTVAEFPATGAGHLASVAVRFALKQRAVGTVITGIRNISQAAINCAISDEPALSDELCQALKQHHWRRYFW